jgi:signal peptidase II
MKKQKNLQPTLFSSNNLIWIILTSIVITIDRTSKLLVIHHLPFKKIISILPGFNLFFTINSGAAFSLLNHTTSNWQIWAFGIIAILVSITLTIWLLNLADTKLWLRIALALILGGAIGNLIDRIIYHHVIDFIDLYIHSWHWPVFNFADTAICIGAVMLFIETSKSPNKQHIHPPTS